jgi:hypothetical protein
VPWGESFTPLPLDQFAFVVIGLVAHRVPALVAIEIEIAIGLHALPDFLAGAVVALLGGAQEHIIIDVQSGAMSMKCCDISSLSCAG